MRHFKRGNSGSPLFVWRRSRNASEKDRLELLRKRRDEIDARIADEEAKRKAKERKEDTRLKVLVGAAFLADTDKNPETDAIIRAVVQRGITAGKDREFLKAKGWL